MVQTSPTPAEPLRIGSRGSPLALAQAELTIAALIAAHGWPREALRVVIVTTSGDRIQDRALAELGGKALWTKELDRALLDGEIDCAVHSIKPGSGKQRGVDFARLDPCHARGDIAAQ